MVSKPTILVFLLSTVAAVLFLLWQMGTFGYYFPSDRDDNVITIDSLLQKNQSFKTGWELYNSGRFTEAVAAFDQSLATVDSITEEAQTKFVIADTLKAAGAMVEAVEAFKEVLANEAYPLVFRAYAATEIAMILRDFGEFSHHHSAHDTAAHEEPLSPIAQEVFKDEPYASILANAKKKDEHAWRDLTEHEMYVYAASVYPLSYAVMGAARWYAAQFFNAYYYGTELSQEQKDEYAAKLKESVMAAEEDIEMRIGREHELKYIPIALLDIAYAHEMLWRFGYEDGPDQAREAYERVIEIYQIGTIWGGVDYYAYPQYAFFLARAYGAEKAAEINSVLSLYTVDNPDIPAKQTEILQMSRGTAVSKGQQEARNVVCAASPNFKEYILSIGWRPGEFCN